MNNIKHMKCSGEYPYVTIFITVEGFTRFLLHQKGSKNIISTLYRNNTASVLLKSFTKILDSGKILTYLSKNNFSLVIQLKQNEVENIFQLVYRSGCCTACGWV